MNLRLGQPPVSLLSLPLLLLLLICVAAQDQVCPSHQECVTERYCNETDDSGRGVLIPRILGRNCGDELVCCDKEQLESYQISNRDGRIKTSKQGPDFRLDYQSCGVQSLCVPRHLCSTGEVNEDGRYILTPRIGNDSLMECSGFETCCPVGDKLDRDENPVQRDLQQFRYSGCGYNNPTGLYYKLVGYNDNEARYAEFPWMVAVMDMLANYVCGGTLIHPQLVLTSAHNVANYSADSLVARAGDYDLNSQLEPLEYQVRQLRSLLRHEHFNKLNFRNDIALLVLDKPFTLAPHVQPLCLPATESLSVQEELRNGRCYAIGWGQRNASTKGLEHILKRIDLPVLEHQHCQLLLRNTVLGRRFQLHSSFLCAGGEEGKDTCQGDGGSPLFCSIPGEANRFQMAGIVSWGIKCATVNIPAVYTNVPYLRSWIDEQVQRLTFQLDGHR